MAEVNREKSAARLASLQKVAAADRSVKRLDALKKCAAADRSTARREELEKTAAIYNPLRLAKAFRSNVFHNFKKDLGPVARGLGIMGGTAGGLIGTLSGLVNASSDEAKGSRTSTLLKHIGGGLGLGATGGVAAGTAGTTAVYLPKIIKAVRAVAKARRA